MYESSTDNKFDFLYYNIFVFIFKVILLADMDKVADIHGGGLFGMVITIFPFMALLRSHSFKLLFTKDARRSR